MISSVALLELKNIGYFDKDNHIEILSDISFKIEEKQILGIAGESGGGKTTLGLILTGILKPSTGEILLNGTVVNDLIKNKDIQILMQNRGELINPYRSVRAVLKEAFEINGKISDAEALINDLLQILKLKRDILNRKGYELSGGEQQRIALARIMAVNPKILILDEPFSAQDIESELIIINLLKKLNIDTGLTIICISHDLRLLRFFTQYIMILHYGKIIESGPSAEILSNPKHEHTKFLLRAEKYDLSRDDISLIK